MFTAFAGGLCKKQLTQIFSFCKLARCVIQDGSSTKETSQKFEVFG